MFLSIVIPLVAAVALSVVVTTSHRHLPPVIAARVIAVTTVVVAAAAVPTIWILSFSYLGHASPFGHRLEWCSHALGVHQRVPSWVGLPTVIIGGVGVLRAVAVLRSHRRLRYDAPGSVEIAGHERPFAYTLPGRGGHIVLSSGLLELLDEDEQAVVLAHEEAHATHRHDRYLLVSQLAQAAVPFLRPLAARLQFSIERWADEAAVRACGDRRFVARTLGKVALHGLTPVGVPSFAGLGVSARMAALLAPPPRGPRPSAVLTIWGAIAITAILAAFQMHHLVGLATALCPG